MATEGKKKVAQETYTFYNKGRKASSHTEKRKRDCIKGSINQYKH